MPCPTRVHAILPYPTVRCKVGALEGKERSKLTHYPNFRSLHKVDEFWSARKRGEPMPLLRHLFPLGIRCAGKGD